MKIVIRRICTDLIDFKIPIILFILYFVTVINVFHAFCPAVILTGYPCPGCGMTRAFISLFRGNIGQAMKWNPMVFPWLGAGAWFVFRRYICGKKVTGIYQIMGVLCIVMIGVHVYRMACLFPGNAPLTYKEDNILSYIVRIVSAIMQA